MTDEHRPHGEHPSLGLCDCDLCQAWDREQREEKELSKAARDACEERIKTLRYACDRIASSVYQTKSGPHVTRLAKMMQAAALKMMLDETTKKATDTE